MAALSFPHQLCYTLVCFSFVLFYYPLRACMREAGVEWLVVCVWKNELLSELSWTALTAINETVVDWTQSRLAYF